MIVDFVNQTSRRCGAGVFVKARSPYKSVDQLKGRNLGLIDPNSTFNNN
jgi:ABC-type phosphate/phosphonate transport system substrate-binding protein